jgi:hypothetical protein
VITAEEALGPFVRQNTVLAHKHPILHGIMVLPIHRLRGQKAMQIEVISIAVQK